MHKKNIKIDTRKVVGIAVFSALAFVLSLVIRFPVMFLTFDVKDAIICTSAFIYGPIAAPIVALLAALLELITVSSTGLYGFLMNFFSSAALSTVASLVYRKWRTLNGAIVSMLAAVIAMVAVMMGANLLITPYYMTGGSVAAVAELIPSVLLPFNLAKGLLNAAITLLIYKPIKIAMKRAGLLSKEKATGKTLAEEFRFTRSTGVILVCAVFMIALSVILFYMLLH
ncbi:MAG: ECF transporter S component [Clostridia bacterium]|nr:ECF transporter S component [Clostridia bacterium]